MSNSRSGRIFFVHDHGLMAQRFDTRRMEVIGTPELIAPQELEPDGAFFRSGFSVSAEWSHRIPVSLRQHLPALLVR